MATTAPQVVDSSGKDMLAFGPTKFHQDIAGKVETALGDSFPRMGSRFKHMSLSADLVSLQPTDSHTAPISAKKHAVRKHILCDITGSFHPGTITLVFGQYGSGKSALMIEYDSVPREELLKRLPQFVGYMTQTDTHLPTLTARETLAAAGPN